MTALRTVLVVRPTTTSCYADLHSRVTMPCPPWEDPGSPARPEPRLETAPRAGLRLCARPVRRQDTTREFGIMNLRDEA
jgi:hypothetical protein